jgi:predicted ATPase
MIRLLQAKNFRLLRSNSVALQPYQVLVGQNATGKSTLLGALQLIGDVLRGGVNFAVERVAPNFYDLCFDPSQPIALAVQLSVPVSEREERHLRYEIEIGIDPTLRVLQENLFILPEGEEGEPEPSLFGEEVFKLIHHSVPRYWRKVVSKTKEGRDYFRDERTEWNNVFRFGLDRAALGSLPEDPERFPLSISARNALRSGIRTLQLEAPQLRSTSSPGSSSKMELDGSNLPHVVRAFMQRDPVLFDQWVQHVGTAIEGLEMIKVREREEDRHLVLEAKFKGQHHEAVTWTPI